MHIQGPLKEWKVHLKFKFDHVVVGTGEDSKTHYFLFKIYKSTFLCISKLGTWHFDIILSSLSSWKTYIQKCPLICSSDSFTNILTLRIRKPKCFVHILRSLLFIWQRTCMQVDKIFILMENCKKYVSTYIFDYPEPFCKFFQSY